MDKSTVFVMLIGGVVLGIALWLAWRTPDIPLSVSKKSTSLPIASNEWKKIDLAESSNTETYVLELKHGWLIFRSSGFGGGMAFVPKELNK